jgi:hypothetical protein
MAATGDLSGFVRDALGQGQSRSAIDDVLKRAGWSADQVRDALSGFADVAFPVPVPRPRPYLSAREAFLYLLMFSTLWVSAFNLGSLLFDLINLMMPDPAMEARAQFARIAMRGEASTLIVAFPVFAWMAMLTSRAVKRDPTQRGSKVRRWLTYLTLFGAATALISDVGALVFNLLGGEITVRFLLKVAVVATIAGAAFGYYLSDLRADEEEDRP